MDILELLATSATSLQRPEIVEFKSSGFTNSAIQFEYSS